MPRNSRQSKQRRVQSPDLADDEAPSQSTRSSPLRDIDVNDWLRVKNSPLVERAARGLHDRLRIPGHSPKSPPVLESTQEETASEDLSSVTMSSSEDISTSFDDEARTFARVLLNNVDTGEASEAEAEETSQVAEPPSPNRAELETEPVTRVESGDTDEGSFHAPVADQDETFGLAAPKPNHAADDRRDALKSAMEGFGLLRDVETCTNLGGNNHALAVPVCQIQLELQDDLALRRIYNLANLRGGLTLHNFGLVEPNDYVHTRGYIRRKNPPGVGHFFVIGTTTRSALLGGDLYSNRQLCARPMWELFRRGTAFAGKLLDESALYVPTYADGVTFSSMVYKDPAELDAGRTRRSANTRTMQFGGFRSRYSNVFSAYTPPGVDIPIYDGRSDSFSLASYTSKLKLVTEEIQDNSVVAVTFTLGCFPLKAARMPDGGPMNLTKSLSFNIKDVILLTDSIGPTVPLPFPPDDHWGIEIPASRQSSPSSDKENIPPLEAVEEFI